MARDYKYRTPRRRKSPPWIWAVIGLLLGLFVAFLVYLQMRSAEPGAGSTRSIPLQKPAEEESREVRKAKRAEPPPAAPKPRFDFYKLLPEMEVVIPEQEFEDAPVREGVKQVQQPGIYVLQAGSFRKSGQADQLRAKLALLGMETRVKTVTGKDGSRWHRVLVGPFDNLGELNDARVLLKRNGVDAILHRVKK